MLSRECQCTRESEITNDCLTRSGTGCFIALPIWQQWASKGYNVLFIMKHMLSWRHGNGTFFSVNDDVFIVSMLVTVDVSTLCCVAVDFA